jgi:hypothetical protein
MQWKRARAGCLAFVLGAAPRAAEACAVCMSGRDDETRNAFLLTTLLLTVLPLAMLGGGLFWIVRRLRALEAERAEEAREPEAADPSAPAEARQPV